MFEASAKHVHSYGNPSYEWTKTDDGYTCTATATCTDCEEGTEGKTVTETVTTIYAITTQPSCIEAGVGTYTAAFTNTDRFSTQTKTEAIAASGHNMTAHEATAACATEGNSAYWSCSACNKYFSDAEGETEIAENSWVIPAASHNWGETTYTWADDNSSVTATRICSRDASHVETETVRMPGPAVTQPAGGQEAMGEYTAIFESNAFESQTRKVAVEGSIIAGNMGNQNLAWTYSSETEQVTVTGPVSVTEPVLVASYDENGRMLSVHFVTKSGDAAKTDSKADAIKLFWLNNEREPKCKSVEVAK